MRKFSGLLLAAFLGLGLGFGGIADVEAKRLGGGGSFGGKSAYGAPYKRSSAQPVRSPRQQQAAQQNQAARETMTKRGGLMGMLGGLALGGLLGALLFGGAFENFNFMDLLIFGGIAYLLYRVLSARKAARVPTPAYARARSEPSALRPDSDQMPTSPPRLDSSDWFRGAEAGATREDHALPDSPVDATLPKDFDAEAFLAGARIAYRDLQKAWDARDFETLRGLSTASMFAELQERTNQLSADNRTDVLKLDAELLEARAIGDRLEAVVLFDAILREDAHTQPQQVREVWHFTKEAQSLTPKWYLDGIQQLED